MAAGGNGGHGNDTAGDTSANGGADDGGAADERLLAGRYLLEDVLGSGGMGKVWQAADRVLDRYVAVKELRVSQPLSSADLATLHHRMKQEARAAARISHPGVVTVHDVFEHDGRPWIVMELVDGRSLADVIDEEGTLLPRDAASVGSQVLDALRAAHDAGVLHRDVKPGNVLLARDGRVLLTDFGIATLEGGTALTRTGDLVGSPDYLAPERALGRRPGPESDLWSLGATLYAAVEGQSPFRRSSALSTLQAVVADEMPQPRHAGTLLPVLESLLRKDPHERPSHHEAARMLREVAEGRSVTLAKGPALQPGAAQPGGDQHAVHYSPTQVGGSVPQPPGVPPVAPPAPHDHQPRPTPTAAPTAAPTPVPGHAPHHQPQAATHPGGFPTVGTGPGTPPDGPAPRRTWMLVAAAVVAASLAGGGAALAALNQNDGKDGGKQSANKTPQKKDDAKDSSSRPETPASNGAKDDSKTAATDGGTDDGTDSGKTGGTDSGHPDAPPGYTWVDDPLGFSMAVPDGWQRRMTNGQVDYTPDGGTHLIRIGTIPRASTSVYDHFVDIEDDLEARLSSYYRVQLSENSYQGNPGAVYEFTWTGTKTPTGPQHGIEQGYLAPSGTEYDLYVTSPAEDWGVAQRHFQTLLDTWRLSR